MESLIHSISITGQENASIGRFLKEMENIQQIARKKSLWRGLLNSLTQIIPGIAYGFALYVGGLMVANNETSVENVIRLVDKIKITTNSNPLIDYLSFSDLVSHCCTV